MSASTSAAPLAATIYDIEDILKMGKVSDVVNDDTTVVDNDTSDDDVNMSNDDDTGDDALFFRVARDIMNRVG